MISRLTIFFLLIFTMLGCTEKPETLVESGYDQKEMDLAIEKARGTIDNFITVFSSGNGESFSVKVPIEDNGQVEHFWLTDLAYSNNQFSGVIGNDPGIVSNVKFGQRWQVSKSDISDWLYIKDGEMHGNYTLRPLLRTMPKEKADQLRSLLAEP